MTLKKNLPWFKKIINSIKHLKKEQTVMAQIEKTRDVAPVVHYSNNRIRKHNYSLDLISQVIYSLHPFTHILIF